MLVNLFPHTLPSVVVAYVKLHQCSSAQQNVHCTRIQLWLQYFVYTQDDASLLTVHDTTYKL